MCGSTAIDGASGGGGGNGAIGVAGGNADRIANRSPIELNASLTQTITGGDGGRKGNGAGGGVSGIGGMVALGGLEQMDQAEVVELEEMPLVFLWIFLYLEQDQGKKSMENLDTVAKKLMEFSQST